MKMIMFRRALLASVAMLPVALNTPDVVAQQITSGVRGTVTSASGAPVSGARITVTDSRTGRTASTTTSAGGRFSVSGLESGGPYTVLIDTDNYVDQQIPDLMLSVSDVSRLNISLETASDQAIEEIVVTAAALVTTRLAIGPSSSFGLETLGNVPSISHDIRDTIRIDPRVNIDQGNDDNISCLGANNRFNSFTIDGVRTSDGFGLNASGFPARNTMPIPFDAVKEVSVEFSPFDVEYGQFTGCSINLVTKAGTNEFHGGALLLHSNDSLIGKTLEGDTVIEDFQTFNEWNWAVDLGGPIIKDKLFFYAAYEEVKDTRIQSSGPIGAGFANEFGPTLAQVEQIQGILETVYGQEPGGIVRNLPEESRRILARLDWFINDQHRAAVTYTRMRELFFERDDGGVDFSFRNNFENSGSEVETYSARLFSDWSNNFSTEIRVSRVDNHDIQDPVGGGELQDENPIPRFLIFADDDGDEAVISGPGFFRSANALITQLDQIKATANYVMGDHTLTAGYELDSLSVFNLFIPGSTGTFEFEGSPTLDGNIADLAAGNASFAFVIGPSTDDPNDVAAIYSRDIHSLYLQDEWQASADLTVTAGLRYDFYKSSDVPNVNPNFVARYGFENSQGFDGLNVLQPRLGFSYDAPWDLKGKTTVRGGIGIFSGGDPTVWFSNAFTNDGFANAFNHIFTPGCGFNSNILPGGTYAGVPQCLFDGAKTLALAGEGPVDAIDPDFKVPSILRYSLGFTHQTDFNGAANGFFDDWTINVDFIRTDRRNAPGFIDLTLTQIGTAPDGRPLFARIDPLQAGCDATFNGIRQGFTIPAGQEPSTPTPFDNEPGGADPADDNSVCASDDRDQDTLLTNAVGEQGGSTNISIQFNKHFEFDTKRPTSLDFTFGYAYTKSKERNPTTSSTAGSNVEEVALSIVNNPPLAPSQFTNTHSMRLAAIFHRDFFDELTTSLGVFWQARSGRPFSYTFSDSTAENTFGDTDNEARQLLYVPTGPTDPLVDFSGVDAADVSEFFAFLASSGLNEYAGQIAPRNAFNDPWFKDMDLRLSQELPTPWSGHSFTVFMDIENFLNLLGDGNNISKRYRRGDVGEAVPLASADINGGIYEFTRVNAASLSRLVSASVWQIQFGIQYRF